MYNGIFSFLLFFFAAEIGTIYYFSNVKIWEYLNYCLNKSGNKLCKDVEENDEWLSDCGMECSGVERHFPLYTFYLQ